MTCAYDERIDAPDPSSENQRRGERRRRPLPRIRAHGPRHLKCGERVTLGSESLDSPGFDLLASFDDVKRAGDAVALIFGASVIPAAFE